MALLLLSSFIAFAIVFRVLLQVRYTGDHGIRFAKIGSPYIETAPGTVFVMCFIISAILIIENSSSADPIHSPFHPWLNGLIGLLGTSGIAITVISQIQLGKSWRIGVDQSERTELMTHGFYSKSRNPIYFGILLYWIALSLSFPHPLLWGCAIVCWICIELIVRKIEEPYLMLVHGDNFVEYCRRSNRYLII